ncbi:hypothetical protein ACPPVQ_01615 [Diaminobutyricibacter sp. McL0618]|uniref:hypothetical protein n=1 Tax=Leifsonia sp. McL0618 TaxID=3415677 RepID=UPI003CFA5498
MGNDIDPRFDPAFQRGYKPKPGERARTRVRPDQPTQQVASPPGSAPVPAPRPVSSAADEVPWPDDEPEPDTVPPARIIEVVSGEEVERDYADEGAILLAGVETAPRRNRYFLALWVMGIGFVALGILLYVMSVATSYTTTNTNGSDVVQLVFSQLGWMLAAPLITVGLLTLVVLVLIQALRPRPRRD